MRRLRRQFLTLFVASLAARAGAAQSIAEMQALQVPRQLALSSEGTVVHFTLGREEWEIATSPGAKATRSEPRLAAKTTEPPGNVGPARPPVGVRSADGAKSAFLESPRPNAAPTLFCRCEGEGSSARKISDTPVRYWQWTADSSGFWVLFSDGADIAFGRLGLDGRLERLSGDPALRGLGGLVAANDLVAWVQSDGAHHGTIWVKDKAGRVFQLWDPNPQTRGWSRGWVQEVVRWKNAHGEELQGVLARPAGKSPVPLVVDPYSGWQNRFLNVGLLGNYAFVKAGFAVFFPNHRAPFAFPAVSFGDAYVGPSRDRDPVEVLADDVMSGVEELRRRGDVDGDRMFLYSFSTGASAIDQLVTRTTAFRAAVSFGGVADWLSYYRANQSRGDETIPNFLGGRKPEDAPALYDRICPVKHVDAIRTPLLLAIGDNDSIEGGGSRYRDTLAFYDALRRAGRPVDLVVYPKQGHGLDSDRLVEQHVNRAIEYFRAHMPGSRR